MQDVAHYITDTVDINSIAHRRSAGARNTILYNAFHKLNDLQLAFKEAQSSNRGTKMSDNTPPAIDVTKEEVVATFVNAPCFNEAPAIRRMARFYWLYCPQSIQYRKMKMCQMIGAYSVVPFAMAIIEPKELDIYSGISMYYGSLEIQQCRNKFGITYYSCPFCGSIKHTRESMCDHIRSVCKNKPVNFSAQKEVKPIDYKGYKIPRNVAGFYGCIFCGTQTLFSKPAAIAHMDECPKNPDVIEKNRLDRLYGEYIESEFRESKKRAAAHKKEEEKIAAVRKKVINDLELEYGQQIFYVEIKNNRCIVKETTVKQFSVGTRLADYDSIKKSVMINDTIPLKLVYMTQIEALLKSNELNIKLWK